MLAPQEKKEIIISVTGLGYVGLPLALLFADKYQVIAYDRNPDRIEMLHNHQDPSRAIDARAFEGKNILFSSNPADLHKAQFHIVAVPTPIDSDNLPDLTLLKEASEVLGRHIKSGDTVVFESTVYPGCTEEFCIPILERLSGLDSKKDFYYGYSPERMNPGDLDHTVDKIIKVVSGNSEKAVELIASIYQSVIDAGICIAPEIRVAEAAKIIENVQRDINIALMNELSILFHKMKIDTKEVLKVASTKWNFLKFTPGLVGGHCIGVDPYYLVYASRKAGLEPKMINYSRSINNYMPAYVAGKLVQALTQTGKTPSESKVLILGVTFKENIADVRNSKVADLAIELKQFALQVDLMDPMADQGEFEKEYALKMVNEVNPPYDAIILAVPHNKFKQYSLDQLREMMHKKPILFDLKGVFHNEKKDDLIYWCL